eukprot:scaffold75041_cov63-Phaeocystis_antarctica.AAC.2
MGSVGRLRQLVRVGGGGAVIVRARAHLHLSLLPALVGAALKAHLARRWGAAHRRVRRAQPAGIRRAALLGARCLAWHAHAGVTCDPVPSRRRQGLVIAHRVVGAFVGVVVLIHTALLIVAPCLLQRFRAVERVWAAGVALRCRTLGDFDHEGHLAERRCLVKRHELAQDDGAHIRPRGGAEGDGVHARHPRGARRGHTRFSAREGFRHRDASLVGAFKLQGHRREPRDLVDDVGEHDRPEGHVATKVKGDWHCASGSIDEHRRFVGDIVAGAVAQQRRGGRL